MSTSVAAFDVSPTCDVVVADTSIGALWRRFLAFQLDVILLGFVGSQLGKAFFARLSQLGPWGLLVGFCIYLGYFGSLDSNIGKGQTLGKKLLKLRVTDAQGEPLSIGRAIVRSSAFLVPYLLFGLTVPVTRTPWFASFILSAITVGVGGTTLYLIVFCRETRRGLHDLATGSYVVSADGCGPVEELPVSHVHWAIIVATLLILAAGSAIVTKYFPDLGAPPEMRNDSRLIEQMDGVYRCKVGDIISHKDGGGAKKVLSVSVFEAKEPVNDVAYADSIAEIVLQGDRYAAAYDEIDVRLFRGYQIGIATHWNHQEFARTPSDWRQRIK